MKVWLENNLNCKLRQAGSLPSTSADALYVSQTILVKRIRVIKQELFITTDVPAERQGCWLVRED